jgi:hypothetical protein
MGFGTCLMGVDELDRAGLAVAALFLAAALTFAMLLAGFVGAGDSGEMSIMTSFFTSGTASAAAELVGVGSGVVEFVEVCVAVGVVWGLSGAVKGVVSSLSVSFGAFLEPVDVRAPRLLRGEASSSSGVSVAALLRVLLLP